MIRVTRVVRGLSSSTDISTIFECKEKCTLCNKEITHEDFDDKEICFIFKGRNSKSHLGYLHTECLEKEGYKLPDKHYYEHINEDELKLK